MASCPHRPASVVLCQRGIGKQNHKHRGFNDNFQHGRCAESTWFRRTRRFGFRLVGVFSGNPVFRPRTLVGLV